MKFLTILITFIFVELSCGYKSSQATCNKFDTTRHLEIINFCNLTPKIFKIKHLAPAKNENQDSLKLLKQKDELSSFLSQFPIAFSIDTLDTVVFNLTNATIVGNMLEFPVTFHSDDYVYSMDFSLKYNNQNVEFDTLINVTNGLNYLYYLNPNDSTLRFTSYRLGQMQNDSAIVWLRFSSLSGYVCVNDLNSLTGYLNGDQCSYKVTDCDTTTLSLPELKTDELFSVFPIPAKDKLFIKSSANCFIQIIDHAGKLVLSKEIYLTSSNEPVDISQLKNGIYFIRVTEKSDSFVEKIVIIN